MFWQVFKQCACAVLVALERKLNGRSRQKFKMNVEDKMFKLILQDKYVLIIHSMLRIRE